MADIKLFSTNNNKVKELIGKSVKLEKSLQRLFEANLETFLGVRFLASEYDLGLVDKGRIDTLGLDENNFPVIIEYKKSMSENVVIQGLFYLNWLLDHKADFQLLVQEKLGKDRSKIIEWSGARLICIAGNFSRYDNHAVTQIDRNIELYRYSIFTDLILLDLINRVNQRKAAVNKIKNTKRPTVSDYYEKCSQELKDIYDELKKFMFSLSDEVELKILERYYAFRHIKNFASLKFLPKNNTIVLWLNLNLKEMKLEKGFSKDVSNIGHHGTGNVEIRIRSMEDFEKAKPLITKSYELS